MIESKRLPFKPLICYSIGHVTLTAIYGFLGAFLLKYYVDYVKLDPAWIGWALLARSIVDAAIDPLIGYLSDRTKLPQGRRRPYFLIGSIPAALLFYLMMTPPNGSQITIFLYLMATSTLMVFFLSLMGISHHAMGFELTTDYDERSRLFGYKNLIENLTILVATFSVPLALRLDESIYFGHVFTRVDCYCLAAAVLAVMAVVAAVTAYLGTSEQPPSSAERDYNFFDGVMGALKNDAFLILLGVFVLITVADRVIAAEFFIVLEQFHGIREEDSISLLVGFFVGGLASVWPWVWLAQRFGKDVVLRIAIAVWPFTCAAFVASQWSPFQLSVVTFTTGVFGTGVITILGAIAPDVLEYKKAKTKQRHEGLYVSLASVVYQVAMGIGFLVAGQTLHLIGYSGETTASPQLVLGLRLTFAVIPLLLSIAALVTFAFFPISKQSYLDLVDSVEHPGDFASA